MEIQIKEKDIQAAAAGGMDDFVMLFYDRILQAAGGQLDAVSMQQLNSDQITLLAYVILRDEVMTGGFIQLIHNGYGGFIFLNPFAKAIRLWGLNELTKLVYKGRKLYEDHGKAIEQECSDEEFMALYEQFPDFDDLDDEFVTQEEYFTETIAHYIDEHLDKFVQVVR